MAEYDLEIDARETFCPIPLLRLKKQIGKVPLNGTIRLRATDRAAHGDIAAFCNLTGQELVSCTESDGTYTMIIRRLT